MLVVVVVVNISWDKSTYDNPWYGRSNAAPFDQEYYIVMNVAVGGSSGYFPDSNDTIQYKHNRQLHNT